MATNSDDDETIGYAGLIRLTMLPKRTLQRYVRLGMIPHIRFSPRVVRFRRAQINQWMSRREVPIGEPKPKEAA